MGNYGSLGFRNNFFLQIHVLQIGPIMKVRGLEATKLYIPSTLNTAVTHTIDWMCSKILNHGLYHGLLF